MVNTSAISTKICEDQMQVIFHNLLAGKNLSILLMGWNTLVPPNICDKIGPIFIVTGPIFVRIYSRAKCFAIICTGALQ